jgi:metallo-beta-lactamase family protein
MSGLNVTFHGAVRTVTGSMHLLESAGTRVLLDCGLYQGRRAEAYDRNAQFPFDPTSIDAVVLSHAHLDHVGNLPTLAAGGFRGRIHCTPATRDLGALILRDSAKVQAQDAEHLRRRNRDARILYGVREAENAIRRFLTEPYGEAFRVGPFTFRFRDAGHILGSAFVEVEAAGRRVVFSGDIGRPGTPILRDTEPLGSCDLLICESTYGDRRHPPLADAEKQLAAIIDRTLARGGKVLVPAFAVGRTQEIVYALNRRVERGEMRPPLTFVDSPMAIDATEIFRLHEDAFDGDAHASFDDPDPFGFHRLRYTRTAAESKVLNDVSEPFIVIAGSGMCESGRILHHLLHHAGAPATSVVFVGFQAKNTLGRRIQDGEKRVRVLGEDVEVRAEVHRIEGFSAHADREELLRWIRPAKPSRAILVHGEPAQSESLAAALRDEGIPASLPDLGATISL